MEHFKDWLVLLLAKVSHISFIAGFNLIHRSRHNTRDSDVSNIGDNLPHVFLHTYHLTGYSGR